MDVNFAISSGCLPALDHSGRFTRTVKSEAHARTYRDVQRCTRGDTPPEKQRGETVEIQETNWKESKQQDEDVQEYRSILF